MTAITYLNTQTNIPGWVNTLHFDQPRGYAYESKGRFFHVYGRDRGLWTLSTGLTSSQPAGGQTLRDWVQIVFGAREQQSIRTVPGEVIAGVWRPGLYFAKETHQALSIDDYTQRSAEQSLRVLIEKLDEILLYIEPSAVGLKSYGHKCRELLILACTEVENLWVHYMRLANSSPAGRSYTTNDYIKLLAPLYLAEYSVSCKLVSNSYSVNPFAKWRRSSPTQSLPWYDAYNKTKHDRESHFSEATLENCIGAIAAVIVMFCVRYGPFSLLEGGSALAGLFIQHFDVALINPDTTSFYVPSFEPPNNIRSDLFCGSMTEYVKTWQVNPLVI